MQLIFFSIYQRGGKGSNGTGTGQRKNLTVLSEGIGA